MARIAGVNIPKSKRLVIALTYIYGVGNTTAAKICRDLNISDDLFIENISDSQLAKLRLHIDKSLVVEGDLKRQVMLDIKRKKEIKCYQGLRHIRRLPVRGQNTHSNARTRKGKAVAIAGKKK
ncbi:MAG TPA: 30S ribosomal protein S13 [Candidatus Megaira endosymbiont of Hartmannula sinica]|nr:30S ribosomal protein S13 [Candidatus Megaera endosymbiont of Hartmannula sinica]